MKRIVISLFFLSSLIFSPACNSSGEKQNEEAQSDKTEVVDLSVLNMNNLLKEIKKREKELEEKGNGLNNGRGIKLMRAYAAFGERFGNRAAAPDYLYKAGEMAMAFELPAEAIRYFDRVYNQYPDFKKRPYVLFLRAFVLENQTKNYEEAKRLYEKFIMEYPTHEMVDDAVYSIENMGKSPEELIREFERQDSIKKASA